MSRVPMPLDVTPELEESNPSITLPERLSIIEDKDVDEDGLQCGNRGSLESLHDVSEVSGKDGEENMLNFQDIEAHGRTSSLSIGSRKFPTTISLGSNYSRGGSTTGSINNRYNMRTGFRTNFARVAPHSSLRDSDLSSFGRRVTSSARSTIGAVFESTRKQGPLTMYKRGNARWPCLGALGLYAFDDPKVEKRFQQLQFKNSTKSLQFAMVAVSIFSIVAMLHGSLSTPNHVTVASKVWVISGLSLGSLLMVNVFFFVLLRKRPVLVAAHLRSIVILVSILQIIGVTFLDVQRVEWLRSCSNLSFEEMSDLCRGLGGPRTLDSLSRSIEIILLGINISHTDVFSTLLSFSIAIAAFMIVSFVCYDVLDILSLLSMIGVALVSLMSAVQGELRLRTLFDRTILTQEALRRNRKLRASFDRHVDNERTLFEHTQILSQENRELRRKAAKQNTDFHESQCIELEAPLIGVINDLRDVLGEVRQKNNHLLAGILEKAIHRLQTKELGDIDISRETRQSERLDAKTKEWLSSATSGWEQQRTRNRRENLQSSDLLPRGDRSSISNGAGSYHYIPSANSDSHTTPISPANKTSELELHEKSNKSADSSTPNAEAEKTNFIDPLVALDVDNHEHKESLLESLRQVRASQFLYDERRAHSTKPTQGNDETKDYSMYKSMAGVPPEILPQNLDKIGTLLQDFGSWNDFNVLELTDLTLFPLTTVVDYAIGQEGTLNAVDVSYSRLINFCQFIDTTYSYGQSISHSEEDLARLRNPYHNNHHAADVVQSLYCFLNHGDLYKDIAPVDRFACIMAAAMHDYHHPGRTNQFLVSQGHPIAIQHNDQSPNERFHLAEAFRVLQEENMNFLLRLPQKLRLEIRQTIIDLVLATDLAQTMQYLSRFQLFMATQREKGLLSNNLGSSLATVAEEPELKVVNHGGKSYDSIQSSGSSLLESDECILLMQVALKVADISHPCKPLHLHLEWSNRIQKEFFLQGDIQKAAGLSVDPLCDRDNIDPNKAQCGFIDFVCRPLVQPFAEVIDMPCLVDNLTKNYRFWSKRDAESRAMGPKGWTRGSFTLRRKSTTNSNPPSPKSED